MPGAPKQFDCDQVLDKALETFWTNGYGATSMQDLVDAMGVNRASLYETFGNKQDLFRSAFQRYCEISQTQFQRILNAPESPMTNIKHIFLNIIDQQSVNGINRGCFVNNVSIELSSHDKEIAKQVRQFWQIIEDLFKNALSQAIEIGELPRDIDADDLAIFLNAMMQGLTALSKAGVSHKKKLCVVEQIFSNLPSFTHDPS